MADLAHLRIAVDSSQVNQAKNDLNNLSTASGKAEKAASGLARASSSLSRTLAGLGIGFGVAELVRMADTMNNLHGRLALVTKSANELAAVESRLFDMSQRTRVGYEGTVELYARLARSTQAMGASQASILQVTETINKALIVSGTSAQEASGSLMQLGQAFASGALRGDELNSVMEGMPRVAQAIAEGMGITVGELRKLGAQGKLTGAEVFNALLKSGESITTEFAKMPVTVSQSMTVLNNALMKFIGDLNESTGFTKTLSSYVIALSRHLDDLVAAIAAVTFGFVAMKASMAVSFLISYISSVIALERALGATSAATAIFSAVTKMAQGSFRALTATMLVNPFVAIAAAIIAISLALYELRDSNIEVGNETVRLGDIFLGVWEVIKNAIVFVQTIFTQGWAQAFASISPALRSIGQFFDTAFGYIGNVIKTYINRYIGLFVGLGSAIKAAFTGGDVIGAFTAGLNTDYVGAFTSAVANGVVQLAHMGAAARSAAGAETDLGHATALSGSAVEEKAKKVKDAAKEYRDYIDALKMETAQIGLTPEQSKALEIEAKAVEANAAGFAELAAQIRAAGIAYAEKAAAQKLVDLGKESADLEFQNSLYGKQAVEVAVLTAAHDLMKKGISDTSAEYARFVDAVREGALQQEADKVKQAWENIAPDINFDSVFGDTGKAFAGILSGFDQMIERQQAYVDLVAKGKMTEAEAAAARQKNAALQINSYGNIAGAMKGFFREGTKGYKALQAAETVFRTIELAMAIKNAAVKMGLFGAVAATKVATDGTMAASDTARSLVEIANSVKTTAVKGVEAVINAIRSLPFPLNIAAGVATAAAVAAFGGAIIGGGGGGARLAPTNNGTGTVFGDGSKQSESIQRSIELLADVDSMTMRYSAQMADSLRSIEGNIGNLTNLILRANGMKIAGANIQEGTKVTGALGSILSLQTSIGDLLGKIPVIGGVLKGVQNLFANIGKALFGTKTSIVGQGITGVSQSLGGIMGSGFQGQYYSDIKKTGHFLGISTGSSYSTQTTAASEELNRQFSLIFKGFYDAISASATPLGTSLSEVQGRLDSFVVNIGKIDLKGLTGEQINEKLNAVFGAAADQMAQAAMPGLEQFQKVGEGYFETVVRVASTVEQLSVVLNQLGNTADLTIQSSMDLVDAFGGLDAMMQATSEYFSTYYSEAEQLAISTQQVSDALGALGLAMPSTLAAYRALVEAQDLTTAAGQAAYAALIQFAPAFASIVDATAQAELEAQSRINDLTLRLYEQQGKSAEALALTRQLEMDAATDAEKAILRQIYALEDYNAAREKEVTSLQSTIDTMTAFSDSLKKFRDSLFNADAGVANYRTALVDLMRVGGLAATGDAAALGQLKGVSETFLTASKARAGSLFEYQKDVALVASYVDQGIAAAGEQIDAAQHQIDLLDAQLQQLIGVNDGIETLNDNLTNPGRVGRGSPHAVFDANQTGGMAIAGSTSDNVNRMSGIMAEGLYAIAKNTNATYNLLDRWDGDGQPDIRELSSDYY